MSRRMLVIVCGTVLLIAVVVVVVVALRNRQQPAPTPNVPVAVSPAGVRVKAVERKAELVERGEIATASDAVAIVCGMDKATADRTVVVYPNLTNKRFYYILTMADTNRDKFDGSLAALRGFLDCYEGSEECGMVCADGVYEKGAVNGTKFIAEAKKLGKSIK